VLFTSGVAAVVLNYCFTIEQFSAILLLCPLC